MTAVRVVVPEGIDDPGRVSGGNRYDRAVCDGLRAGGWGVTELAAPGAWPRPGAAALAALRRSLAGLPDGAVVLVDGLIGSAAADVLVPESVRLRLVLLVHMVFGGGAFGEHGAVPEAEEAAVLGAARAVIATSRWSREQLLARYPLHPGRVHVALPGTEPALCSPGTPDGRRLLCVAAVAPHKGQDVLVDALAAVAGPWRCTLVGAVRDPVFASVLERRAVAAGTVARIRWTGPLTGGALRREWADADLLVLPSLAETYGMVVTEALAAGLPVVATGVGGVPEALGRTDAGVPGLLVPPADAAALAGALTRWLADDALRSSLRRAARCRRAALPGWPAATARVAAVLAEVAAEPDRPVPREPP